MIRIAHISDWHDLYYDIQLDLANIDLIVCTGDMLPNYPQVQRRNSLSGYDATDWTSHKIVPSRERREQPKLLSAFQGSPAQRDAWGDTPVVCVRGNHDFVDIGPLFGKNLIHEFRAHEVVEFRGIAITGHRGIPYIYGGWNDEVQRPELLDRARAMPEADLILTHYPPAGILDNYYGLDGMGSAIGRALRPGGVHCFGHIHECGGRIEKKGAVRFSNAACHVNYFEIDR